MKINKLFFYIGYDSKEDIAYRVCKQSLIRNSSIKINVNSLKLYELISQNLYTRSLDPLASTEFTYSRFLIPKLMNYEGWAIFCDCDFLFFEDIALLFESINEEKAVYCVQHDYIPKEKHKMDGQKQTIYPRKNWSSFIVFNCSHPSNKKLNLDLVNNETGSFLHQFKWLKDSEIGSLDERWNWLEGWTSGHNKTSPNAVHFTRGGPWFDEWQDVEYAKEWIDERNLYLKNKFNL
jgi:lipopolysaccharide biosynthesis glycosyltransferase|tara:strand:- start:2101 stop:2805 length:705 start_codon:yes stop_codon:yes gene_type:complete